MSLLFPKGVLGAALLGLASVLPPAAAAESSPSGPASASTPTLGALGGSLSVRPTYSGSDVYGASPALNFVLRWGRFTVSNGGTLASRAGEPVDSGVSAELYRHDRLQLGASLRWDAGRRSQDDDRLRGVHDVPAHLRGRLYASWRLHPQWELNASWRPDVSGRGTGSSVDFTVLHQWKPEFLDHRLWRVSAGVSVEALDARRSELLFGISPEDASRTAYSAFAAKPGFSQARGFLNWRRELPPSWVAYGGFNLETLVGSAAESPLTIRRTAPSLSAGLGYRF